MLGGATNVAAGALDLDAGDREARAACQVAAEVNLHAAAAGEAVRVALGALGRDAGPDDGRSAAVDVGEDLPRVSSGLRVDVEHNGARGSARDPDVRARGPLPPFSDTTFVTGRVLKARGGRGDLRAGTQRVNVITSGGQPHGRLSESGHATTAR